MTDHRSESSRQTAKEILSPSMISEKSWDEFRASGLLWWTNRFLHLFGWSLVVEIDDNTVPLGGHPSIAENVTRVYPAHCKFRGFSVDDQADELLNDAFSAWLVVGIRGLTKGLNRGGDLDADRGCGCLREFHRALRSLWILETRLARGYTKAAWWHRVCGGYGERVLNRAILAKRARLDPNLVGLNFGGDDD